MGNKKRQKSSPGVDNNNVKRPTMAASSISPPGFVMSPNGQQGQSFSMPPTYNYVPQYTTLTSVPLSQPSNMVQGQQNVDVMTQILQRLDLMDNKLGKLDTIQSAMNTVTTRMSSVEQK